MTTADDTESDHPLATWLESPTLELIPSTTEFTPQRVVDCLSRWYRLLEKDEVLEWRVILDGGECRYAVSAADETLDHLEPTLRQALPDYSITRTDGQSPPELDEASLVGVRFEGHGTRKNDWQTGLQPLVSEESTPAACPALTSAVDTLAGTDATVVYQALITRKQHWGPIANDRIYRLEQNRDTFWMRFFADWVFPTDPTADIEPDPVHQDRIDLIRAIDTGRCFQVAARAVAFGPDADAALEKFSNGLNDARGPFYTLERKFVHKTRTLVDEMAEQTMPTLGFVKQGARWFVGSGVKPTLTMDPRTLAHCCLIEGATLTDAGRRMLGTTPDERTNLGAPGPDTLAQYDAGFTLGTIETPDEQVPTSSLSRR